MVGTDRSETAEQAVQWAAGFAERFGAELHVVQVILPPAISNGAERAADLPDLVAIHEALLAHARTIAGDRARGRVVVHEDPAMAIVDAAAEDGIDVVVVGNAGMAGRRQFLLGNVPNRISHNARCTVIIVNTGVADGPPAVRMATPTGERTPSYGQPVVRGATIASVVAKHGIKELLTRPIDDSALVRRRRAKRLHDALEELGPTFAKIGQILSTRPDLLPPEFIEELALLRDRVAPLSEAQVVRVMEQDLGVPWEDVFETIDPSPLAAGTIGQVHRATLAAGGRVVIKVQRPEARALIEQDLALLKVGAKTVGSAATVKRYIDLPAVFEHLSTSLQQELDFRREAANAERLRAALAGFTRLAVPEIHSGISTARLLVMQDVGGAPLAEVPEALRHETAKQLLEAFYKQILIDGFFHADPHPGNLMWQPTEQRLYFLDLGMMGEVDPETRELLILLLMAFWRDDAGFLTEVILMLSGSTDRTDIDVAAFRDDMRGLMDRFRGTSIKDIQLGPVLQEMLDVSFRHGVPLPASLALTVKALAQMQMAAAELDPNVDPFEVAGQYLTRSLVRRALAKGDPKALFYESQKFKVRAARMFEAVERMVGARPGDRLEVNFKGTSIEATVRRVGRQLALGVVAGFGMLAGAIGAAAHTAPDWTITFGVVGLAALVLLGVDMIRTPRASVRGSKR